MEFQFTLSADEVKAGMRRERLREETIAGVVDYFREEGMDAQHDATRDRFRVTLNLNDASLSPGEARMLSVAMGKYRVENT
ncbi:hypothetical protein [Burkholderia glumae]|uniref:hypothetical protein n=1 Tax=Burkholderia glumae TaxID=337 RepID=UPI002150CC45|nr:hypothetical protein [Burkholderia glumae]